MNSDELINEIVNQYDKLTLLEKNCDLKNASKELFNNLPIKETYTEILDFIAKVEKTIRMTSSDISTKYKEQNLIINIMRAQVGFFLTFYSFLVSEHSYIIDESTKEEISSWFVDILSNLNLCITSTEWVTFMNYFVISFHPHLSSVLLETYECLGLDIPSEIEPEGYNKDEDMSYKFNFPVEKKTKKSKKVNLKESLENLKNNERNAYRSVLNLDNPSEIFNHLEQVANTIQEKTPKNSGKMKYSESRLSYSREKKNDGKEGSLKKPRKRRSLARDTPNVKADYIAKQHRAAVAAAKKLNGKVIEEVRSSVPSKAAILSPITLRKCRRANSITMQILESKNGPANEADMWVRRQQDEERSLTNFSTDSCDLRRVNSMSSVENTNSTRRVTRFSARLFDSFFSPVKGKVNDILSPTKSVNTKSPSLFSPKKTANTQKLATKENFMSPKKSSTNTPKLMSPIKIKSSLISPSISLFNMTPVTPQKSCLKSPLKKRIGEKDSSTIKRRKTIVNNLPVNSVLLSPKVNRRTFLTNTPSHDYCEDTMFMDTSEFIRSSGVAKMRRCDRNTIGNGSPLPAYLADSSQSSLGSFKNERVKVVPKRTLSVQRCLFDSNPSSISTNNIIQGSRRSTIVLPDFNCLEPETDESNGFKY